MSVPEHSRVFVAPPPALDPEDRIAMATQCRDADPIPKVPDAGKVIVGRDGTRVQVMHNGLKVVADGYYGGWMTKLIGLCRGHHEPQEERVFHEVVSRLGPTAAMVELGGFWAYYSLWFLHGAPGRRAIVVEPDPANLEIGKRNAALNRLAPEFVAGYVAREAAGPAAFQSESSGTVMLSCWSVPQLLRDHHIDALDILHLDIQGAELGVIESCAELFRQNRIGWVFVSTHAYQITGDPLTHQRCLSLLRQSGAVIEADHDVHESFSGDGLIVARFAPAPPEWRPVELTRNRYCESLFRSPIYDLAERLSGIDTETPEHVVSALYEALLLRPADPSGLRQFADLLRTTKDASRVIEALAASEEFVRNSGAFLGRYTGFSAGRLAARESVGSRPLVCSGFHFTLDCDGPLGARGDTLLMPTDRVMMPYIAANGVWHPAAIDFTVERLDPQETYVVLDIGANIGLFSRQLLQRSQLIRNCICIEPDPHNFRALTFNLAKFEHVRAFNVALGSSDGKTKFYRDLENMGNYSLHADAMRHRPHEESAVAMVATERWMPEILPAAGPIIWKSDTQGNDEAIISQTPWDIWNRVCCAIIELWRIHKPLFDSDAFRARIDSFPNRSIELARSVSADDVLEYLRGNDWSHVDLYLWR
jgi:FkbM family methyltransferase